MKAIESVYWELLQWKRERLYERADPHAQEALLILETELGKERASEIAQTLPTSDDRGALPMNIMK